MVRTQISLTQDQMDRLHRVAVARGVSMAAVIRDAVETDLAHDDNRRNLTRAVDAIRASTFPDGEGKTDVSRRHDDYLADAFEDRH